MSTKILNFEIENVKRVSLVRMQVSENGLTVIGGDNAQGKTSVLDAILYALGGEKYRPSELQRRDGIADARIRIELSGGIVVERKGKNAALHVTDSTGKRSGQTLLNSLLEELAMNLPAFLKKNDREKAEVLLRILGIGDQLAALDREEQSAYDRRHDAGVIADQKEKYAKELPEYPDVPEMPLDVTDLTQQIADMAERNARKAQERIRIANLEAELERLEPEIAALAERLKAMEKRRTDLQTTLSVSANPGADEDPGELNRQIREAADINAKVSANLSKASALDEASELRRKVEELSREVEAVRAKRLALLDGVEMPLPGLTIGKDGKGLPVLMYNGAAWDCMSTAERFRVSAAIIRKLKPECGFILADGLEAMDSDQLKKFDSWLKAEGLQAIGTRVGKGEDCTIVIEDGYAVNVESDPVINVQTNYNQQSSTLEDW